MRNNAKAKVGSHGRLPKQKMFDVYTGLSEKYGMDDAHLMLDSHRVSQLNWRAGEIQRLQQVNRCAKIWAIKLMVSLRARVHLLACLPDSLYAMFIYIPPRHVRAGVNGRENSSRTKRRFDPSLVAPGLHARPLCPLAWFHNHHLPAKAAKAKRSQGHPSRAAASTLLST